MCLVVWVAGGFVAEVLEAEELPNRLPLKLARDQRLSGAWLIGIVPGRIAEQEQQPKQAVYSEVGAFLPLLDRRRVIPGRETQPLAEQRFPHGRFSGRRLWFFLGMCEVGQDAVDGHG